MKREGIILRVYSFNRMAKFTGTGLFEPYKIDIRHHVVNLQGLRGETISF